MRLIEVVSHIDREASGPGYSVPMLCRALAARGHEVALHTLARDQAPPQPGIRHLSHAPSAGPSRLGVSNAMRRGLVEAAGAADLVHNHGLWMAPNVYSAMAASAARKALVISPRGTFSPVALRRSAWLKRVFWTLAQGRAVRAAAALHATSEQEYRDIRARGLAQPVAVIPNGIDIPEAAATGAGPGALRRLLYLGRLHPIKGLEVLIQAWANTAQRFPDWELSLVGPGEAAYRGKLERLAADLGAPRVSFAGPAYGAAKGEAYCGADLYVLPSFSENFGMSVAEALAAGLPVIATTGTPWSALVAEGCGWQVEPKAEPLAAALAEAMARPPETLAAMGARGRTWMARNFSWARVAAEMEVFYLWVLQGGAPPPSVRLD